MHISTITFVVLLLSGCVLSADNETKELWQEPVVIPDGSFVAKNPIVVFPHINHDSVECFPGAVCKNLIDCLRSSKMVNCGKKP
jgi:hypothetical protein